MSASEPVPIRKLPSGVPGLDEILGGGIAEYSFNIIAGAPGTGKTTLAEQIIFANATAKRPALHFTVLGEPPFKMLRYQQQFEFFDIARVGTEVRFLNLSQEALDRNFDLVLERIAREVEEANAGLVVVDSFRTMIPAIGRNVDAELALQYFVQRLALRLTTWESTTFLVGEYAEHEARSPVFTVADGIIWLLNEVERNSTQRKLRVTKARGQAPLPGLHAMRISTAGVEVFPRYSRRTEQHLVDPPSERLSMGVPGLDDMMGGGVPRGDSVLVAGPTGAGKSMLALQFAAAGLEVGDRSVIAVFEERPATYVATAARLGIDLEKLIAEGEIEVQYLRIADVSAEETLHGIRNAVERIGAKRVVIDSLTGFESVLAPSFRLDFRDSYYRLLQDLSRLGISTLSTVERSESQGFLDFSSFSASIISDDILAMRYVELGGELRRVLAVVKMRGSDHSRDLRLYTVDADGLHVGEVLHQYRGIITGVPEPNEGP
ncbi:MAG TPA: ATPase domain-containing protein [Gemmatimonadaceae bacterium]|nr:ATPase domain-containing protein [Gemmatimonadaceae bacterium]